MKRRYIPASAKPANGIPGAADWRKIAEAMPEFRHGIDCEKVPHTGEGYLHGENDNLPYDVDGWKYCGRCHKVL
jgi:hypothetical protein